MVLMRTIGQRTVISHHGRSGRSRCAAVLALGVFLLALAELASADGWRRPIPRSDPPNTILRKQFTEVVTRKLQSDRRLPGQFPLISGYKHSARVLAGGRTLWLAPLQVRYASLSNRYCRLAVMDERTREINLAPLPSSAMHDTCSEISAQWLVDANGSGAVDIVQLVHIQSNRGDFLISEPLVYLYDPQSEVGYCYSSEASRELSQRTMHSRDAASSALKNARARLGINRFSCDA
ncbi:hypothetical protein [Pseudorhodoferax sp.]|uniref:hypothetical protein n=1 Tax=Pseudorhodoferax sp. TaxID=1993553 RepID=UPI0039E27757